MKMFPNNTLSHQAIQQRLAPSCRVALLWLFCIVFTGNIGSAQNQSYKISFKDSIDNHFDLSDWVLTAHGFIPVPSIITEPAVGGFGGSLFALFIDPNTPYLDSLHGEIVETRAKPNLYAAGASFTVNGTWLVGGIITGVIKRWRSNYRLASFYADANLMFYKELSQGNERSFEFNLRMLPTFGQLIKQFGRSDWYAGMNYLFLKTEIVRTNTEFHDPEDSKSIISRPGFLLDYDYRDNDFTPNKGVRWNTLFATSAEWLGSDYTYYSLNSALYTWFPVYNTLIAGFRTEYQQTWNDIPFFMLPYIGMRGIPAARYQGHSTALFETEWRWDFTKRWSVVGFGGGGKAMQENISFKEASWHIAGGAGGRYLIARKLGIRGGIDVARGPESWAYYIVLGSYWVR